MTTKEVLQLDYRLPENKVKLQKVLRQIKPLAKCPEGQDVPIEKLERVIKVLTTKYSYYVPGFVPDPSVSDGLVWRTRVLDSNTMDEIGHVFGCMFYEVLAKTVILLYSEVRKRKQ